ncbi:unnamed protein product [Mytilus edulis]|uniref:C-type lectin domain-containing protein n=1 Tax=Mytilus edulis TaxID=6550 RepID=A0A8S3US82_MYTED|nr:unnamed protein product [Mytilus edulis]
MIKENCDCLGGKLLELETAVKNEFIKDQVRTLDTGVEGYWIGGYNFNNDDDMEWISKPNQVMPFSDMESDQPNNPDTQPCMMIWRDFNFLWDILIFIKESCQGLGGKLVELETQEENEFIKNAVMTISSGVKGYWIGGYDFNNDGDLEWLSKPNQVMPFSDWYLRQPNAPGT